MKNGAQGAVSLGKKSTQIQNWQARNAIQQHSLRKGQLVIPKSVRQSAHLAPGDILSVSYVEGEIRLKPLASVAATSLDEVAGCLAKPGRKRMSERQTQTAIKARLKARHSAA